MKDNTMNKQKTISKKTEKVIISNNKKLRDEEKPFVKES